MQIHFVTLNSSVLKKSIIKHCLRWQVMLGELLRKITEFDIDEIYTYVEKCSEAAMQVYPKTKVLRDKLANNNYIS